MGESWGKWGLTVNMLEQSQMGDLDYGFDSPLVKQITGVIHLPQAMRDLFCVVRLPKQIVLELP